MKKLAYLFIFPLALSIGCQSHPEKQNRPVLPIKKHFPNTLVNKRFLTEQLIGLTADPSDYLLNDSTVTAGWVGNTVEFIDSVHFVSAYRAWCGNDCFTTVYGRYYFVDSLKVSFHTDSIVRHGECQAPIEYTKSRPALNFDLITSPKGSLKLKHTADPHAVFRY